VDDAHVLSYPVLECLRDLHDEANVGIVLAGTTRLSGRVSLAGDAHQMYEQLRARVQITHKLGKPSPSDVEAVARAWAPEGVAITREAMDWLAHAAVGLGALRVVKAHVRMALRLGGDMRITDTLSVEHLSAAHQQLDVGVLA
jgi:DNA transposition AAA+ family ATPase